ncbi:hypothetical protein [Cohnella luojiensis]|uniref:Uncharacterized protein n=1 Tax=Cohnella luojiensis TaxID=652876 RepID=A0A4Y8M328_9BACL|nr:hypothetical protein [Cohnella luojiensis]TFE29877.1 hypothetical protein E2980_03695 [Cohnella luojiensis]
MRNRIQPWFAVVLAFMAIGLATSLFRGSTQSWLIPLSLVAIVYFLYKFPPSRWKKSPGRGHSHGKGPRPDFRRTNAKSDKRRASPFTVIEGRKNKDDEPPRYH